MKSWKLLAYAILAICVVTVLAGQVEAALRPSNKTLDTGAYPESVCPTLSYVGKYDVAPILGTTSTIHAAIALDETALTIDTEITQPDVPRTLNVTGNTSGITGNVAIVGRDAGGARLTDTIALNGTATVAGTKAFRYVSNITVPIESHGSGDAVTVGVTTVLGLPYVLPSTGHVWAAYFDNSLLDTDGGAGVTAGGTFATTLWTNTFGYTYNGVKRLQIYFPF